jgi:hypothetical protein
MRSLLDSLHPFRHEQAVAIRRGPLSGDHGVEEGGRLGEVKKCAANTYNCVLALAVID